MLIGITLGVVIGFLLGLTGAGGGVLAVPLLMAGFGWTLRQAGPVALIAIAASATLGAYTAWRRNYVRYRAALLMGLVGSLCAPFGLSAARHLPLQVLTLLFAGVMVVVALRMWRQSRRVAEAPRDLPLQKTAEHTVNSGHLCQINPQTGRLVWTPRTAAIIGSIGAVSGFLSGLLGVGGGFVIVPALRAVSPLWMHTAVATSLMTIALIASGTVCAALLRHADLPWLLALPFVCGTVIGMALGRWLAPRVAGAHLERGFALMMALVVVWLGGRVLI